MNLNYIFWWATYEKISCFPIFLKRNASYRRIFKDQRPRFATAMNNIWPKKKLVSVWIFSTRIRIFRIFFDIYSIFIFIKKNTLLQARWIFSLSKGKETRARLFLVKNLREILLVRSFQSGYSICIHFSFPRKECNEITFVSEYSRCFCNWRLACDILRSFLFIMRLTIKHRNVLNKFTKDIC